MKKIIKKLKGKKVLSFVLAAIMLATTFNIALPMLKLDASAALQRDENGNIIIGGVTQKRVVGTDGSYGETYAAYAYNYGQCSEPTNIVVPGVSNEDNYVIQGMAYYPQKDWILVTAYSNKKTADSSKVFCLDAVSGDFVAMLSFRNVPDAKGNRTANTDHGGGIAISEHNLYYACGDQDRKIAYAPLSALDGIEEGEHRVIDLVDEVTMYEVGSVEQKATLSSKKMTAYTAYVCYDQGVLWTGNFFDEGVASIVAADYKVPANSKYQSMVWGYRLSGNSSEEEWENLTSGDGSDCQGSPSYAIALPKDEIKQVQYATVDNGKLYLSCSYGTASSLSTGAGFDAYSSFHVADIDLSVPGTEILTDIKIDANGSTKDITGVYVINDYTTIEMPPMSEGVCMIDDYLFTTFESASYKYRADAGALGECPTPIDVVWKIDQYKVLGAERPNEERSLHYEEVTSANFTDEDAEYIIAYESTQKDPITQKRYLYALNSSGGYQNHRLSKNNAGGAVGYVGMEAHIIKDYNLENGILYLNDMENDDVDNVRWKITSSGIKNTATYFANQPYLYFTGNTISMTTSSYGGNIKITSTGTEKVRNGNFYLSNGSNYLWCNDGSNNDYNTKINNWYDTNDDTTSMYSGVDAKAGMIYPAAASNTNIIKAATDLDCRQFRIFKRVIDDFASTKESKVYTDMNAELQADGTYTVNLETYATATTQFIERTERPTDFIFVLDTSASMTNNDGGSDCSGYQRMDTTGDGLTPYKVAGNSQGIAAESGTTMTGNYFVRIGDEICPLSVTSSKVTTTRIPYTKKQYFWLSGVYNNQTYWWKPNDPNDSRKSGTWQINKPAESETVIVSDIIQYNRATEPWLYEGEVYLFNSSKGTSRLCSMQTTVHNLIRKIKTDELNHRVALVQYGSDGADEKPWLNTAMYYKDTDENGNVIKISQPYKGENSISKDVYEKAFFNKADFGVACDALWEMNTSGGDSDTYSNYGFDMANGIIDNSGQSYLADGDRGLTIIMITDGIPGKGGNDTDSAQKVADASIAESHEAKQKGAWVYSVVMSNDSIENFNMSLYREYVSSLYPDALSMRESGNKNTNGVQYSIDIPTGTADIHATFTNKLFESIQENSTNGIAHLDGNSVLKEQLSLAFKLPEDFNVSKNVKVKLIPGLYDAVGRVSFYEEQAADATGVVTVTPSTASNGAAVFDIKGYQYSDNYIGKGGTNGHKLRVTLTGVLANELQDITNTSINNADVTAIYHNSQVVKRFPTEYFNIPEYTYVLDYGFDMYDSNVNGTIKALANTLDKQDIKNYTDSIDSRMVEIRNNYQDLLYRHNPVVEQDSGYVLIQRPTEEGEKAKYDWFEIKVVPASNVLYEESALALGKVEERKAYHWNKKGSPAITYQDLSTEKDVYGYDNHYESSIKHSNNTYYQSSVDSDNKRSDTAVFKFKGTGFDLISACGPTTGVQLVNIKRDGKMVRGFIVDTYYDGKFVSTGEDKFYQVPIVSWDATSENLADDVYGEYTVEVTSYYLSSSEALKNHQANQTTKKKMIDTGLVMNYAKANEAYGVEDILADAGISDTDKVDIVWFDDNSVLNGGTGASVKKGSRAVDANRKLILDNYIDGIRVYNPIQDTSSYIESERNATYYNIIDELASTNDILNGTINNKVAFVTGSLSEGTLSFANYESIGPEGEFYLNAGSASNTEALVFNTRVAEGGRVMISLRAVNDPTTVKINGTEFAINSATEMYYDITDLLNPTEIATGSAKVTIINTGGGILSVNNIKLTNTVAYAGLMSLNEEDLATVQYYANMEPVKSTVKNGVVTPVEDEEDIPEDNTNTDNDNTNDDANTEESEKEEFSLFSLIEMLIAFIEKILYNAFGAGSMA